MGPSRLWRDGPRQARSPVEAKINTPLRGLRAKEVFSDSASNWKDFFCCDIFYGDSDDSASLGGLSR